MSDTLKPGAPGYAERLATDPLFLANESLRECSSEVVRRTEHYEARIATLERREALLTRFAEKVDIYLAAMADTDPAAPSARRANAIKGMAHLRAALTAAGFTGSGWQDGGGE